MLRYVLTLNFFNSKKREFQELSYIVKPDFNTSILFHL